MNIFKTMSYNNAYVKTNDVFDELIDENQKLKQCLNVLIRFKSFVDWVYNNLKTDLDSNTTQLFDRYNEEVKDIFKRNGMPFDIIENVDNVSVNNVSDETQTKSDGNQTTSSSLESFISKKSKSCETNKNKRKSVKRQPKTELKTDENKKFICCFVGCGKTLGSRDTIRAHMKRHEGTIDKKYKCDFNGGCGYCTDKRDKLLNHINSHKGIKAYVCDKCHKRFATQKSVNTHKLLLHSDSDQILICDLDNCNKQFKSELSLKNHQNLQHLMERSFICLEQNCSFKTISATRLRQHTKKVHLKERPFKCSVIGCGKAYQANADLVYHMLSHNSDRKFKCDFEGCNKGYFHPSDLRKHKNVHSDRFLKCDWPGCDYTTKLRVTLASHQVSHTSDRNFVCHWPQCGKSFKRKTNLNTHLRIHNSDKKYSCSWPGCHYRCTDSGNLIKHKRVHNKT